MHENDSSSQQLNREIQGWRRKAMEVQKSVNCKEIKNILEKVLKENSDEGLNFIKNTSNSFNLSPIDLNSGVSKNEAFEIISLTSEMLQISHRSDLAPCILAKVTYKMVVQHPETKALETFIESLTSTIIKKLPHVKNLSTQKALANLLRYIVELQKQFMDKLIGCINIIKLVIYIDSLQDYKEIQENIQNVIIMNIKEEKFIVSFFNNEKSDDFYKICVVLATIKPFDFNIKIFCNHVIKALGEDENILESPELYDEITKSIINLLTSNDFDDIECSLVQGMLIYDNFLYGVICFDIVTQFLFKIDDPYKIVFYFHFFQNTLLKIWDRKSQLSNIQQVRIAELLNHLLQHHFEYLTEDIKDEITILLDLQPDNRDRDFLESYQQLKDEPTTENYENLICVLRNIQIDTFTQEEMKSFVELVELLKSCDWIKFESLIVQILKLIKDSKKIDRKMILLLKLETIIDKNMSMEEKELLLGIIFKSMKDVDKFQGLSRLIDNFLDELLNKSYATRRVWFDLNEEDEENCNAAYAIDDENITLPTIMKHNLSKVDDTKLSQKEKLEDSENYKKLTEILEFSEKLKDKVLSQKEHEILQKIIDNFKSAIPN